MKRKAKQKKLTHSSTNQCQNEFVGSPKLDGPRTRSSNEHLEHAKPGAALAISLSEDTVPTRGRLSRNGSEPEGALVGSLSGGRPVRGRRSKTSAPQQPPPSQPQANESRSYLPLDGQSTPLLNLKGGLELASSISNDFDPDDAGAPELVAMHDLSVSSTPSTFIEPRHFVDKGDTNALHNQRRLNKRELKALLKQTKKTRATLDENILATMEQLADQLKDGCAIDLHPAPPRPVRMASPPSVAPPPPLSTPTPPSSPVKRCPARGRGGRKGRGGRRGAAKLGVETTTTNQTPPPQSAPIPASWVPLILPYRSPTANEPGDANPHPFRSHFTPWLNQLSEARVHRFTVSMRHVLSQHFVSEPALTSFPILRPDANEGTTPKSLFDSTFARSTRPIFVSESNASTGSSTLFPQSPTAALSTSVSQLQASDPNHPPPSQSSSSHEASEISPDETQSILPKSESVNQPGQTGLKDMPINPSLPVTPAYRPRGRGRGRRFSRSPNLVGRGSYPNTGTTADAVSTVSISGGSNLQGTNKTKPRVSRELRGLVTWDAVIAQQRRQQEQERLGANSGSESKVQEATDALLAVAHDMIAAVAVEEDNAASRTRRTRQSSGSAFSQSGPSTFHSDTGSVITASGSAAHEINYNPKTTDQSSTARSVLSTESSSVTSDLFTSNLPGFEHTDEPSVNKLSTRSPGSMNLRQTKLEHKEAYSTPEPGTGSPHSALHSCEEAASSFADPVKYSPISTDQDPDVSHTANTDRLPEITYEKTQKSHKRGGQSKRRGRKLPRHQIQTPTLLESSLMAASNKTEPIEENTPSEAPHLSELYISTVTVSNTGKRKRQLIHNTPPMTISDPAPMSDSAGIDDWGVMHSADEAAPTASPHSSSTGVRRTAGSRSAALPPRKRYKVSIDSATAPPSLSGQTSVDNLTKVTPDSFVESKPRNDSPVLTSAEGSTDGFGVAALSSSSTSIPTEPTKKRARGRPSRRGANVASDTVCTPPATSSSAQSDPSVPLLDRPKREAAAIGFASLVAANLNNSMTQAGSGPSMDSPTRKPISTTELPATTCPPPTTDASDDSVSIIASVPSTTRGRGRPPRIKTPKTMTISSTPGLTSDSLSSLVADNSSSEVVPSTSRRKRLAVALSSNGKTNHHAPLDSSPSSNLSETKIDSEITTEPPAKKTLASASPRTSVRYKLSEIAENGNSSSETPTEMPWKVFVDQLSNKRLTPSRNGESNKDTSDLDSVQAEQLTNPQPIESLFPATQPSVDQPKATTSKRRFKGRPRIQEQPQAPYVNQVDTISPQKETKDTIPASDTSTFTSLPERVRLFKGHLLTDPVTLGTNQSAPCKGPLCDLFLRFLNEPDPSDPTCRLAAPIVYLPTPERNPEFYRFVISSYSSGSGFRIRFSESLLRRLFTTVSYNCSDQTSTTTTSTTTTAVDEALFDVEFPSLCLASVARRLYDRGSLQTNGGDLADWLHTAHGLTESELACVPLDANDTENCLPLLDAAIESVLTVWESFAGRRSWLGRRLLRLRSVYTTVRSECAISIANTYGLIVPPLKATAVLNLPYCKPLGPGTKKKSDRRALERGAEVIRCLCGFRVEGGHVMVQCDRCASWQHLPCLWWALNKATECRTTTQTVRSLCKAALAAAHAAGSGYLNELVGSGVLSAAGASASSAITSRYDGSELPYFCPVCLGLTDLTLEYPRSLSAAMAMDDLASVFSLQETIVEGEHEFWSLASPDGAHQIRTDDYAFINRSWLRFSQVSSSMTPTKRTETKQADQGLAASHIQPIGCAYDRVVIRIYRLWKDSSGRPWLEGGLFLRPYDVVQTEDSNSENNFAQCRLWHRREVIYDEASRLVLPLAAWNGRCAVLCPSAFRAGRPADLLSATEAINFLTTDGVDESRASNEATTLDEVFFVCDKLFERTPDSGAVGYRFDEISPGYLKINMRPYCFFRKPDVPGYGRPNIQRQYTAAQLLEFDRSSSIVATHPQQDESVVEVKPNAECGTTNLPLSSTSEKPKGEKLARLVDWLERKRRQDAKAIESKSVPEDGTSSLAVSSTAGSTAVDVADTVEPIRSPGGRGRPPRRSRGRGRPPRTASVPPVQTAPTEMTSTCEDKTPTEQAFHTESVSSAPCSPESRQPQIFPTVPEASELQNGDNAPSLVVENLAIRLTAPYSEKHTPAIDDTKPEDTIHELPSGDLVCPRNSEKSNASTDSHCHHVIDSEVSDSNNMNVEPTVHIVENSKTTDPCSVQPIAIPVTVFNEMDNKTESPLADNLKPVEFLEQSISTGPSSWCNLNRCSTRRKRSQTRKRTASESKLSVNSSLIETELQPHVLSDSETMVPSIQTPLTGLQVTDQLDTLVPCSTESTNHKTPEAKELLSLSDSPDDTHEIIAPVLVECIENAMNNDLQEQHGINNSPLSHPTEEINVTPSESCTDVNVEISHEQNIDVLKVNEIQSSQTSDQTATSFANAVQESTKLPNKSGAVVDENSEATLKSAGSSANVISTTQPDKQLECLQSKLTIEQKVVDHALELEAHRTELNASPERKCENSPSLISDEPLSNVTELPPSPVLQPRDLSQSSICCRSPQNSSADNDILTKIDVQSSASQATDTDNSVPSLDPSVEPGSNTLSLLTYPSTNKPSTKEAVPEEISKESSPPTHECNVSGSVEVAPSLDIIPVYPKPFSVHIASTNTKDLTVCDESSSLKINSDEPERLIDSSHCHSSPVSERLLELSDEPILADAPAVNETQPLETAGKSPTALDSVLSDTTVDPNSTPILDEPGSDNRFDAEVGTTGQIKPNIVGCLSDTASVLLFPSIAEFGSIREEPSIKRLDSCIPSVTNSNDPSSLPARKSKESSDFTHHVLTESTRHPERSHPRSQPKDSRSDSRHSSTHSDRASSGHYQSPRSYDHHSQAHHHHHRHYSRDRRDRSPTSSSRRSSSSSGGNGGGSGRTSSHQSPTAHRNDSRRNDMSWDFNHHRRSPSNSPRSSTSYHRHSYNQQPRYYHDPNPQRYRHHPRKESTRPRNADSSSMRVGPESSSPVGFRSSQRDHDPYVGTRNS